MTRSTIVIMGLAAGVLLSCQRQETVTSQPVKATTAEGSPAATGSAAGTTNTVPPVANGVVAIAPPTFLDMARLGAATGADGAVATESAQFTRGQTIYFSMHFKESPKGLAATSRWYHGKDEKDFKEIRKEMKGANSVTFDMKDTKKWKPGHYRVEGYWGGNLAATKEFDLK
jgi:hypothetical protein